MVLSFFVSLNKIYASFLKRKCNLREIYPFRSFEIRGRGIRFPRALQDSRRTLRESRLSARRHCSEREAPCAGCSVTEPRTGSGKKIVQPGRPLLRHECMRHAGRFVNGITCPVFDRCPPPKDGAAQGAVPRWGFPGPTSLPLLFSTSFL